MKKHHSGLCSGRCFFIFAIRYCIAFALRGKWAIQKLGFGQSPRNPFSGNSTIKKGGEE